MPPNTRPIAPIAPSPALRVALYTRVSTDMQATKDEGSLDTQEARLRSALAARSGNFEVAEVFREEGESGKSLDRPALQRLLGEVRARHIDLVMVTRIDRLSRSLLDFYEMHTLFEETGVQFVSLNETFDTSSAVGRAMLKLVLVFAELEREQTAERTRMAMRARAERGLWNGGRPPLGYDSQGNGHIVVNEAEAELVKQIFAKYIETRSTTAVFHWIKESGHRQKAYTSRRKGSTGGKSFTVAGIMGILTNRLYLGEIEHKGERFRGQHDAIIDQPTFDVVGTIMETNSKTGHGPPLRDQYPYLLTGVLKCACGHALTTSAGNGQGGKYFYYRCVGVSKKPGHECSVRQVRADKVDAAVLSFVRDTARDPKLLSVQIDLANQVAKEHMDPLRQRIDHLSAEVARSEQHAAQVLSQILSAGIMSSPSAKKLLTDAETRTAQLRESLAQAYAELESREGEFLNHEVLINAIRTFDGAYDRMTTAERRELLNLLCERVEVHPDRLVVQLYQGRRAMYHMVANPRLRAAVTDANPSGLHETEPGNDKTPSSRPGFVSTSKWLPLPDLNRGPSD